MWSSKYRKAQQKGIQLIGDKCMRNALIAQYGKFANLHLLEEVRLGREVQADFFMIDVKENVVTGFEIKSDRDTLERLPQQLRGYLKYCNCVVVYTSYLHKREVRNILNREEFEGVGLCYFKYTDKGGMLEFERYPECYEAEKVGVDWISRNSKLKSWDYWLENIWG